ncbi:MAG TPA: hypothetical protein DEB73_02430 [Candidatus Magasanikbacteria bacterium]|nr:hypothetical protein [Candidatus Magasanikbacteria bacterium]
MCSGCEGPRFRACLPAGRFHPQGKDADEVAPAAIPVPVVAVERARVPIQLQPVAINAADISASPKAVQRDSFAGCLVMGKGETGEKGDIAE